MAELASTTDLGWTPHSRAILQRSCEHYGGLETWRAISVIRLRPNRLSGFLPWLKGSGKSFPLPASFEIRPHQRSARFLGYPDAEHVGVFEDGAVRVQHAERDEVVLKSDDHRRSFRGFSKHRRWTPLDALYFFGYALTHYHTLPFSLSDARLIQAKEVGSRSDRRTVLDVELPADLATHCRRQRFFFDSEGRITRHDYHSEIVGFWAHGAHFWKRQTVFKGFPISLERHVVARAMLSVGQITALHATFTEADVEFDRA